MDIETNNVTASQQENLQAQSESSAEQVTLVNGEPYVNGILLSKIWLKAKKSRKRKRHFTTKNNNLSITKRAVG